MGRYQSKSMLYGVELTHEQATKIYQNEMYEGSDLSEVIDMKTNNDNFYKEVGCEYDEKPEIPHYLGVEVPFKNNKIPDEQELSVYKDIFNKEAKNVIEKYEVKTKPALFTLTSVC